MYRWVLIHLFYTVKNLQTDTQAALTLSFKVFPFIICTVIFVFTSSLHLCAGFLPHPLLQSREVSCVWHLFQSVHMETDIKTEVRTECNHVLCMYYTYCIAERKRLFTSAAAFNFILMYRFESSRSPTCKETKYHFPCILMRLPQYGWIWTEERAVQ